MIRIESVAVTTQTTFGRDGAMFENLLGFVAQLSLVLWSLVVLTTIIRFVGVQMYRRSTAGQGAAATASPAPGLPATSADVDLAPPSGFAVSLQGPGPATLTRAIEPRAAAQLPQLVSGSSKA